MSTSELPLPSVNLEQNGCEHTGSKASLNSVVFVVGNLGHVRDELGSSQPLGQVVQRSSGSVVRDGLGV